MEKQNKKNTNLEKKDILEEVKELDRKVRSKIVYDKLSDVKQWAKEIAELKLKTQFLLEELGVEVEDVKRLIDYATNAPEYQLDKEDIADLKDEVREMIAESKTKVQRNFPDYPGSAYVMHTSIPDMTTGCDELQSTGTMISGDGTTTWTSGSTTDNIDFNVK